MGKQTTEMLKGVLEGIVLALLATRSAYGVEITAWLREQGFEDIAEGTVYALLVRIEQRQLVEDHLHVCCSLWRLRADCGRRWRWCGIHQVARLRSG